MDLSGNLLRRLKLIMIQGWGKTIAAIFTVSVSMTLAEAMMGVGGTLPEARLVLVLHEQRSIITKKKIAFTAKIILGGTQQILLRARLHERRSIRTKKRLLMLHLLPPTKRLPAERRKNKAKTKILVQVPSLLLPLHPVAIPTIRNIRKSPNMQVDMSQAIRMKRIPKVQMTYRIRHPYLPLPSRGMMCHALLKCHQMSSCQRKRSFLMTNLVTDLEFLIAIQWKIMEADPAVPEAIHPRNILHLGSKPFIERNRFNEKKSTVPPQRATRQTVQVGRLVPRVSLAPLPAHSVGV
mmetsp:Transcript_5930/g.10614  ORF Transcript_5930/g.10614 Transcript_5930/m.10614 type:complete len:294 (+) Transcript_5930:222-1103(+)